MSFPHLTFYKSLKYGVCLLLAVALVLTLNACRQAYSIDSSKFPKVGKPIGYQRFLDKDGEVVDLRDFHGKSNVVLVFMRGFAGYICPYCTQQTAEILRAGSAWKEKNAQVFIVYPGPAEAISDFLDSVKDWALDHPVSPPQPALDSVDDLFQDVQALLDVDLKATEALGIRADLAVPSSFVLDTEGKVRFTYAGKGATDRPDVQAILNALDAMGSKDLD